VKTITSDFNDKDVRFKTIKEESDKPAYVAQT
jgi:hypothetical protein